MVPFSSNFVQTKVEKLEVLPAEVQPNHRHSLDPEILQNFESLVTTNDLVMLVHDERVNYTESANIFSKRMVLVLSD